MANIDRPNGFAPVKNLYGSPWSATARTLAVAARTDATNNHGDIYIGDPITVSASGVVSVADSGVAVLGVVVGIGTPSTTHGKPGIFDPSNLVKQYLAHDEAGYVWYVPAEGNLFEIQTASALSLKPGMKADHNVTAATAHGDRDRSQSDAELVTATNNDVIVIEDATYPNNDTTLANARHLVMFLSVVNTQ
jgi:hypothetical protein